MNLKIKNSESRLDRLSRDFLRVCFERNSTKRPFLFMTIVLLYVRVLYTGIFLHDTTDTEKTIKEVSHRSHHE
jgi:hypothetical protein